jgi:putative exosortase-associated protein (TIGR04073 family)
MKKLAVLTLAVLALGGVASADIQAPPGSNYTSTRKLGRALGNIIYGFVEIPSQIVLKTKTDDSSAGWSYGAVDGTSRTLKRLTYGFYELFTFTCPTYRGTFKPPYERCGEDNRIQMNPKDGLSEFPPQLGGPGQFFHTRTQDY